MVKTKTETISKEVVVQRERIEALLLTFLAKSTRDVSSLAAIRPDVKIFNYALTEEQIKTEYNNGAVRFGE